MTKKPVVIVIVGDDPPHIQNSPHLLRLKPWGTVKIYTNRPTSQEEQIYRVRNADIVINSRGLVTWPREVLEAVPKLRMIAACGTGRDAFDLVAAKELGIQICTVPSKAAKIVAEHALALMFAVAKRTVFQTTALRSGQWLGLDSIMLQGKTLGIIGTGNSGAHMAKLSNSIGMVVLAWTFHPSDKRGAYLGVRFMELDELLRTSDIISLHVRLSDDTHHMISKREISLLKPGAIIINTARGQLVDTVALIEALNRGHLGGAGLDVFEEEPLPVDHPILSCDQVVLTPHSASMTPEGVDACNKGAVDNIIAYLEGHPQNVVNQ